ncbi:hypothetical protein Ae201684P_006637 [Aphanomyces euteiches]|nr:hypothetical protein Ae201684P_006637 [Aphanomyces euteiches]
MFSIARIHSPGHRACFTRLIIPRSSILTKFTVGTYNTSTTVHEEIEKAIGKKANSCRSCQTASAIQVPVVHFVFGKGGYLSISISIKCIKCLNPDYVPSP